MLETFAALAPGIVDLQARDTTLLGSPITSSALEAVLKKKTENLRNSSSRLQQLTAHSAFYLLRASSTF